MADSLFVSRDVAVSMLGAMEAQRLSLNRSIDQLRAQLNGTASNDANPIQEKGKRKRSISASGLRRMRAAQKKRWAAFRENKRKAELAIRKKLR